MRAAAPPLLPIFRSQLQGELLARNKGSEVIERLLDARHLEHVSCDADTVTALIATARRPVTSATADDDPEGALALAYDAARKTATALPAHQGLRPTSAGGHIVVVDAMNAQVPGVAGRTPKHQPALTAWPYR